MWNWRTSVFPNTSTWEQQEWNKDESKEERSMERSKADTKEKISPDVINYSLNFIHITNIWTSKIIFVTEFISSLVKGIGSLEQNYL